MYTQDNDHNDKILNKWNIHFPLNGEGKIIKFEIKSFHNAFLGQMSIQMENLKKGLNYIVKCENKNCNDKFIKNRETDSSVIEPSKDLSAIICSTCNWEIENFSSIVLFILKESKGNINFRSENNIDEMRSVPFDLNENQLLFFRRSSYRGLCINILN